MESHCSRILCIGGNTERGYKDAREAKKQWYKDPSGEGKAPKSVTEQGMNHGSGNLWSGWDQGNSGSGNPWSEWDQRNSIPSNFSQSSSLRSSGHDNFMPLPSSGLADWRLNNHVQLPSFQRFSDARSGANGMRQFDDSPFERRITSMLSSNTRFPSEFHPSMQIILFDSMSRETRPRMQPVPPRELHPRFPGLQRNAFNIQSREDLAKLEQEKTLKMLKKVIYSSDPKNLTRRLSQYYKGSAGSSNASIRANSEALDEDSKRCAICLDDFESGTEVMVTPCNHMFHEDCILPWMKSHGQCPVCRFVISEQIKAKAIALSSASAPPPLPLYDDPFTIEGQIIRPRNANPSRNMFFSSF